MNIDAKILTAYWQNQILQYIKKGSYTIIKLVYSVMQAWLNIQKSINVIHYADNNE